MNIHSESIFHYTDFKTLKAILNDGCFRPSYCKEYLIDDEKEYYVPMVSFCDIPLSQIPQLSNSMEGMYGKCAIGMNKNWSLKNGLNPVLYIHPASLASHRIICSQFTEPTISERESVSSKKTLESDTLSKLLKNNFQFNKNFEGKVTFGNPPKTIKNYIFYKEREWRYVPNIKEKDEKIFPSIIFDTEIKNSFGEKPHFATTSIYSPKFNLSDISYLVVENNTQKWELILWIMEQNPLAFTLESKEMRQSYLFSNIFTVEQIKKDF